MFFPIYVSIVVSSSSSTSIVCNDDNDDDDDVVGDGVVGDDDDGVVIEGEKGAIASCSREVAKSSTALILVMTSTISCSFHGLNVLLFMSYAMLRALSLSPPTLL